MEETNVNTNLRVGNKLLDLYGLRNERKYYGSYIQSDVEYVGRLHSVDFSNFHAKILSPFLSDSIVLDLGCGQLPYVGSFSEAQVKEFYGVDLSVESLKIGRSNFKRTFPLNLVRHEIKNIPFREASVDVVVSSEVLEHVDDPKTYLREIYRVIKKGGYLSLSTPCASIYLYPLNLLRLAIKPVDGFKKINCHKHWEEALNWHPGLRPRILKKWMEDTGFSIKRHETRLWYYDSPIKLTWRLFSLLERAGILSAGNIFSNYLKIMDKLLGLNIPIIKWCGIRQFILCKKS